MTRTEDITSVTDYDELAGHAELARGLKMVEDGVADIAAARTRPLDESFAHIERVLKERLAAEGIPDATP